MDYISSEVIPLINEVYRTTGKNTLFGHSLAGYFTLNMLADMPTLFDNFIAASPVLQVNEAETLTKFQTFSISGNNEKSLYMTLTDEINEGADATRAMRDLVESLRVSKPDNLNWHYDFIPDQRHMTTPYLTLYKGLTNVFLGFQAPSIPDFEAFQAAGGIKGIEKYYVKRAEKYLVSSDIPERTLINMGLNILDSGHRDQGIEILILNTRKYPNSFRAMNALAMAYEEAEQQASALDVYKRALAKAEAQSSPASNHFKAQIERLDKQSD